MFIDRAYGRGDGLNDHQESSPTTQSTQNGHSIDLKLSRGCHTESEAVSSKAVTETIEHSPGPTPRTNEEISHVLSEFIGHRSYRQVGEDTGFHPESVRRYLRGQSRIPADFVGTVCSVYNIDAMTVLIKDAKGPFRSDPKPDPEDRLAESLGEWLKPQMTRWMQENIVPNGLFQRSLPNDKAGS